MTMWCNRCGAEFQQMPNSPAVTCRCGSTVRQSWKPQPYFWWGTVSSSGGAINYRMGPKGD